jgi:hypothetical protein
MNAIAQATGESLDAVRVFLDSRHGRHFADDVQNGLQHGRLLQGAIAAAVERWMGWTIGSMTSREYGIPRGLPYLTGFVLHTNIASDAEPAD